MRLSDALPVLAALSLTVSSNDKIPPVVDELNHHTHASALSVVDMQPEGKTTLSITGTSVLSGDKQHPDYRPGQYVGGYCFDEKRILASYAEAMEWQHTDGSRLADENTRGYTLVVPGAQIILYHTYDKEAQLCLNGGRRISFSGTYESSTNLDNTLHANRGAFIEPNLSSWAIRLGDEEIDDTGASSGNFEYILETSPLSSN